jgi:uncharacterized protein
VEKVMFTLIPRDMRFFDLIEEAGAILIRAAEAYAGVARDSHHRSDHMAAIRQLARDGDEVADRMRRRLASTFITPFDREDIYNLIRVIDDIVDEIDAAAKRLAFHEIDEPTAWLTRQTEVFLKACYCVGAAVPLLRNLKEARGLRSRLDEIRSLEDTGDDISNAARAELYCTATNPIDVTRWKEIYDSTERALDRCDAVAHTLETIVLKNA